MQNMLRKSVVGVYITSYFLYRIRKILKLSIRKFHPYFDMTYSYYYKIEQLKTSLDLSFVFYVLETFDLNLYDLQKVIDLIEDFIRESDKFDVPYESDKISESTLNLLSLMCDSVLDIKNVEHFDEILGFKAVAEVDELIYNMIKDSDTYKEALKK